jgi:hypothetical protein
MLRLRRGPDRPLSGRLVIAALIGSATLRCLYGFLLLYFAFAVKAGQLNTSFFGHDLGSQAAVALVGGALAVGTFLSTAIGTRLRIRRPTALQSSGLTITAGVGVLAAIFYSLPMVALLALVTSIFSGISKLAVDASIQERVPERLRASAFAHSETVLMIAWVVGGAVGIIPLNGRLGIALAALFAVAAAVRAAIAATRLRTERLHGRPEEAIPEAGPADDAIPEDTAPEDTAPEQAAPEAPTEPIAPKSKAPRPPVARNAKPPKAPKPERSGWRRTKQRTAPPPEPVTTPPAPEPVTTPPAPEPVTTPAAPDPAPAPPGFHIYRPTSAAKPSEPEA